MTDQVREALQRKLAHWPNPRGLQPSVAISEFLAPVIEKAAREAFWAGWTRGSLQHAMTYSDDGVTAFVAVLTEGEG